MMYHSTYPNKIHDILKSDTLKTTAQHSGGRALSLSRGKSYWNEPDVKSYRLILRGDSLGKNKPYAEPGREKGKKGFEYETHKDKPVTDLKQHLAGVEVSGKSNPISRFLAKRDIRKHTDVPVHFVKDPGKMDKERYLFHKSLEK